MSYTEPSRGDGPPPEAAGGVRPVLRTPFLLLGACQAIVTMALYVPWFLGLLAVPTLFGASDWYHHSILFGLVPAVLAALAVGGDIRRPVLTALILFWLVGRMAVACSAYAGPALAVAVDSSFFVGVIQVVLKGAFEETGMRGFLRAAAFAGLLCANAAFHWEIWRYGEAETAGVLAIAASLTAVLLVAKGALPRHYSPTAVGISWAFAGFACLLSLGAFITKVIPAETVMHAWTSGAAATLCAAAIAGHNRHAVWVAVGIACAALSLMSLGWFPGWTLLLLPVAGLIWIAAFLGAPILGRRSRA